MTPSNVPQSFEKLRKLGHKIFDGRALNLRWHAKEMSVKEMNCGGNLADDR
jgi:hypothetical protein